jgi:hypothetical protein
MEIVNISEMSIENSTGKFRQFAFTVTVTSDHPFTEPILEVADFEGATDIEEAVFIFFFENFNTYLPSYTAARLIFQYSLYS